MSTTRPTSDKPHDVFHWLNNTTDPKAIREFLNSCHENNYAKQFKDSEDRIEIILHALTTNDVRKINVNKLEKALLPVGDILIIVQLAMEALKLLIDYLKSSDICRKKTTSKEQMIQRFKGLSGNNAFINLAKANLSHQDLSQVHLQYGYLVGANLRGTSFNKADISHANLAHTDCEKASFMETTYVETRLEWANLKKALMADLNANDYSLKSYLQTNWPKNAVYNSKVTPEELTEALTCIQAEVQLLKAKQPHSLFQKLNRHYCHQIVAEKLSMTLLNEHNKEDCIENFKFAYDFPYFSNHSAARGVEKFNHMLVVTHNFFSKKRKEDAYFANPTRNILLKGLHQAQKNRGVKPASTKP